MKDSQTKIQEIMELLEDGNNSFPSPPYCFNISAEALFDAKKLKINEASVWCSLHPLIYLL